jgi:hypothetical protein
MVRKDPNAAATGGINSPGRLEDTATIKVLTWPNADLRVVGIGDVSDHS